MNNPDSIVREKYQKWLLPFISPGKMPDNIIEEQQAKQLVFYLFLLTIGTAFNLLISMLIGDVTTFTIPGFVTSLLLYSAGRTFHYKIVAIATTVTALILPFFLFIFSPAELTIVAVMFLLMIALLTAGQFLSLQVNLQVAIVAIIAVFMLNTLAIPDVSLSFTTILIPVIIFVFMTVLNAYGRERMRYVADRDESPQTPELFSTGQQQSLTANEGEATFRMVAAMISDYAYALDVHDDGSTSFAWVSGDYSAKPGLSYDEIMTMPDWTPLIHQDDRVFYSLHIKALLKGESASIEYRILKPDGSLLWIQDSAYPIYDEIQGRVTRIPGVANDVTDKVQSEKTLKTHIVQQVVVAELGLMALNTNDAQQIMEHVTILCEQVLNSGFVAIFEHEADDAQFVCVNVSRSQAPVQLEDVIEDNYSGSLAGYTLYTGEAIISEDIADDPHFKPLPAIIDAQYSSAVGITIMGRNNAPYGVLTVYSMASRDFSHEEIYFLQSMANVLGTFIERNRAQAAEREQAEFTEALRDATAAINSRLELPEVLAKIMSYLQQVVPQTQQASIMLRNDETGRYYHQTVWGFDDDTPEAAARYAFIPEDFPLLKLMAETSKPINLDDVQNDERWIIRDTVSKTQSYLAAPIILDDEIIGFINLHGYTRSAFSDRDTARLKTFADTVSTAIVNAQKQEDLERKVEQRTLELNAQSQRLSTILAATGDGIFYTENDRIAFVNEALCELTGYTDSELLNQSSSILQPDDILPQELDKLYAVTETIVKGEIWRDTLRLRRKDDTTFDAGLTITQVASPDEENIRAVTLVRDMSKERELEELKKTFIAAAAHDLRSPISSLQMRMHMIKHQPEKMDYHMQRLDQIIERMNRLVNDLLDTHGRIVLRPQNIILQDMLDLIVDILSLECEEKGIQLDYQSLPEPIIILADKHRLEQVFYNLITNAINYTDSGGQITIAYRLNKATQTVMIDVRDTGSGIPLDEQESIFLPFYRAKKNQRKGNGLGLSITREIVNLHQGGIKLQSRAGKGSTFTVLLPLLPIE